MRRAPGTESDDAPSDRVAEVGKVADEGPKVFNVLSVRDTKSLLEGDDARLRLLNEVATGIEGLGVGGVVGTGMGMCRRPDLARRRQVQDVDWLPRLLAGVLLSIALVEARVRKVAAISPLDFGLLVDRVPYLKACVLSAPRYPSSSGKGVKKCIRLIRAS